MKLSSRNSNKTLKVQRGQPANIVLKLGKVGNYDDANFKRYFQWKYGINQMASDSSPGVLYGLPKVYKYGSPFRPIVSSVNTYNYSLASYLVLQPISTYQFTVKDSFSFAEWAKPYNHNNEFMCSFDVTSLFTNVPLDDTIYICPHKLSALPNPPTSRCFQKFTCFCHQEEPFCV